jgi:hypothetical protein
MVQWDLKKGISFLHILYRVYSKLRRDGTTKTDHAIATSKKIKIKFLFLPAHIQHKTAPYSNSTTPTPTRTTPSTTTTTRATRATTSSNKQQQATTRANTSEQPQ